MDVLFLLLIVGIPFFLYFRKLLKRKSAKHESGKTAFMLSQGQPQSSTLDLTKNQFGPLWAYYEKLFSEAKDPLHQGQIIRIALKEAFDYKAPANLPPSAFARFGLLATGDQPDSSLTSTSLKLVLDAASGLDTEEPVYLEMILGSLFAAMIKDGILYRDSKLVYHLPSGLSYFDGATLRSDRLEVNGHSYHLGDLKAVELFVDGSLQQVLKSASTKGKTMASSEMFESNFSNPRASAFSVSESTTRFTYGQLDSRKAQILVTGKTWQESIYVSGAFVNAAREFVALLKRSLSDSAGHQQVTAEPGKAGSDDVVQQLEKLANLLSSGFISSEEHAKAKSAILGN